MYGNDPVGEANVGAPAVQDGADCLLIDAEIRVRGQVHAGADVHDKLRALIGHALSRSRSPASRTSTTTRRSRTRCSSGRGGAQYNVPQMYWKDIGARVDGVYAHTYVFNRLYERPISPLGQVYNDPPTWQIERFRQLQRYYSPRTGVSWWDWQQASAKAWFAISQPIGPLPGFTAVPAMAALGKGAIGDMVVWAQEHLVSAGDPVTVDGAFGPKTFAAVESFQLAHGLPETGLVDTDTWTALLHYAPAYVRWRLPANRKGRAAAVARASSVAGLAAGVAPPKSASLPELGDELPGAPGRGRP